VPLYAYKARSRRGELINGEMESLNTDSVASKLIADGLTPVDIDISEQKESQSIDFESFFAERVNDKDLIQFSRQMHSLLRAGVPILSAFTAISKSTNKTTLKKIVDDLVINLESGRDLATCLNMHKEIFSVFYVSMIRIGETTGNLDLIFIQLARYLERDQKTRQQIKKATRYPGFVMIAISLAVVILNIFVIPIFAKMFAKFDSELPWMTQLLFLISDIFSQYWIHIGVMTIGVVFGVRHYVASEKGRYKWDKAKLNIPLIGSIIHRAVLARFARLFSMASRAGVPLITALNVVARALDNVYIEEKVMTMQAGIERGDSVSRTATSAGIFDGLVLQMISIGEESGTIDELLEEVADYYDVEVDYEVDRLASAIEPILTVVIGLIVLVLALGIFLPMWELSTIQVKH